MWRELRAQGDKVVLKVNKLTSIKTQLPYEYYSMPYCRPEKIMPSAEKLGEVLRGDRIENSPYEVWSCRRLPPLLLVCWCLHATVASTRPVS